MTAAVAVLVAALIWVDASGQPTDDARAALALLKQAEADGLDPREYADARLDAPTPLRDPVAFDTALSAAMLRYLRHLHNGRVDPRAIGFRLRAPGDAHDFGAMLTAAVEAHRVGELAASLRPAFAQYDALCAMLARYRSLVADRGVSPLAPRTDTVRPGAPYDNLGALHRLLVAVGDLPPSTPEPAAGARYDGAIVDAVARFQRRHDLEPDGVIGRKTLDALRVPLSWRARQIELALERLRWLPHVGGQVVAINIPMFRLWAWDGGLPGAAPSLSMNVIVGRALGRQTPVFVEEMTEVIFRPYWNVPRSILRNEILPILDRDLDYLRRENMELVRGPGDDARPAAPTPENVAKLRDGSLRLRQRPGPRNALGLIKFVFPNQENVYMHDTPVQALFARSRRDFSHGCVRVEDPIALAEWALRERSDWDRARIESAIAGSDSVHVPLRRPIQVLLFYTTAAIMPDDGTVHFADDIYRHDARLDAALQRAGFPAPDGKPSRVPAHE